MASAVATARWAPRLATPAAARCAPAGAAAGWGTCWVPCWWDICLSQSCRCRAAAVGLSSSTWLASGHNLWSHVGGFQPTCAWWLGSKWSGLAASTAGPSPRTGRAIKGDFTPASQLSCRRARRGELGAAPALPPLGDCGTLLGALLGHLLGPPSPASPISGCNGVGPRRDFAPGLPPLPDRPPRPWCTPEEPMSGALLLEKRAKSSPLGTGAVPPLFWRGGLRGGSLGPRFEALPVLVLLPFGLTMPGPAGAVLPARARSPESRAKGSGVALS